jgi:hypothetical protein
MKLVLGFALALVLAACSTTKKADTTTPATAETVAMTTETSAASAPTSKKAKTEMTEATSASSSDGFPSIAGTEKSSVTCTNKSDTRKISVLSVTEGGCGVVYNKMGSDKTVAMAKSDSYCENVSSKIKTNLEGAGFSCGGAAATGTSSDQPAQ